MRYLKSVLFIVLVSVFAVQANANVLLPTSLMKEAIAPKTIIDIVHEGRSVQVSNVTNETIELTVTSAANGVIYWNTLSPYSTVTLSDLAPGYYELRATSTSGSQIVPIIIE